MEFSSYYKNLEPILKNDYKKKVINLGFDPFNEKVEYKNEFPQDLTTRDIVSYLCFKKSNETENILYAAKGLDGLDMATKGWVKEIKGIKTSFGHVVYARVFHSMRMNETPLKTWAAIESNAKIKNSHCDCVAGFGEVCTHVGILLFYLLIMPDIACTSQPCSWVVKNPRANSSKKMSEVFQKKTGPQIRVLEKEVSQVNISSFLTRIHDGGLATAVMKVVEPTATKIFESQNKMVVDADKEESFAHLFLSRLYSIDYKKESNERLKEIGESLDTKIEKSEIDYVEKATRQQTENAAWFKLRIGRVTGSIFRSVCRTSLKNPAESLLKKMCFPSTKELKTKAVEYGRQTEEIAFKKLKSVYKVKHKNLKLEKMGLVIDQSNQFYAASPDGMWDCDCCGQHIVEIKCPFRIKDKEDLELLMSCKSPFILKNEEGEIIMNKKHQYYHQIQLEMHVTKLKNAFFYIYSKKVQMLIKVKYDEKFMKKELKISDDFINFVIKPQLLANRFYDPELKPLSDSEI